MRSLGLACLLLASAALVNCSSGSVPAPSDGPVSQSSDAIAYGTQDTKHTAVVALLANAGGGSFSECSGSIVQIKNGYGYVLTAAHCCNMGSPDLVIMANDYSVGENYLFGGTPQPPTYAVDKSSIYYDAHYNGQDHDFCMLKFSGVPAGSATLALPSSCSTDGVANNVAIEHVGYGITDSNNNNSVRRTGTDHIDQGFTSLTISYSQGGASHTPGPCEGDSGGPALIPAGAAQGSQTIVATTSYGNSSSCSQGSLGVSSRVCSEIGSSGFITNFLNDTPIGTAPGSQTASCDTCAQSAESGTCKSAAQACANDPQCLTLNTCLGNCSDTICESQCEQTAGTTAVNELNAFDTCVCNTACQSECATECGGSSSTSSTTGGGNQCGLQSSDATCNTCLDASCCSEAQACAADNSCVTCLGTSTPPASCNTNAALAALSTCLEKSCATACGLSTGSTTSSTAATTGSGNNTTAATGTTTTGTGVTAGGNGGAGGGDSGSGGSNSQGSGCSVAAGQTSDQSGPLAGLLLAVALAFSSRRRRA